MALDDEEVTATMTSWMLVDAFGDECLFGFAERHPSTGGLSWVLSTPVVEINQAEDRARTKSGRVYALGRQITPDELDEEGSVALGLLLEDGPPRHPADERDKNWLVARKMARHLQLGAPPRSDPAAVVRFLSTYRDAYVSYLIRLGLHWC
jgi:hypothetical protein